jgi:hypothetical protein
MVLFRENFLGLFVIMAACVTNNDSQADGSGGHAGSAGTTTGTGGGASTSTASFAGCEIMANALLDALEASSACQSSGDCRTVLLESASVSVVAAGNDSGTCYVNQEADVEQLQRLGGELNTCEGGLGPSGVGVAGPACVNGKCGAASSGKCPTDATECPANCFAVFARPAGDAAAPEEVVGCTPYEPLAEEPACGRRERDGTQFIGTAAGFLRGAIGWQPCP